MYWEAEQRPKEASFQRDPGQTVWTRTLYLLALMAGSPCAVDGRGNFGLMYRHQGGMRRSDVLGPLAVSVLNCLCLGSFPAFRGIARRIRAVHRLRRQNTTTDLHNLTHSQHIGLLCFVFRHDVGPPTCASRQESSLT